MVSQSRKEVSPLVNVAGLYSAERIEAEIAFLSSEEFWLENASEDLLEDPFMADYDYNVEDEKYVF